jgi:hypothetical protein
MADQTDDTIRALRAAPQETLGKLERVLGRVKRGLARMERAR